MARFFPKDNIQLSKHLSPYTAGPISDSSQDTDTSCAALDVEVKAGICRSFQSGLLPLSATITDRTGAYSFRPKASAQEAFHTVVQGASTFLGASGALPQLEAMGKWHTHAPLGKRWYRLVDHDLVLVNGVMMPLLCSGLVGIPVGNLDGIHGGMADLLSKCMLAVMTVGSIKEHAKGNPSLANMPCVLLYELFLAYDKPQEVLTRWLVESGMTDEAAASWWDDYSNTWDSTLQRQRQRLDAAAKAPDFEAAVRPILTGPVAHPTDPRCAAMCMNAYGMARVYISIALVSPELMKLRLAAIELGHGLSIHSIYAHYWRIGSAMLAEVVDVLRCWLSPWERYMARLESSEPSAEPRPAHHAASLLPENKDVLLGGAPHIFNDFYIKFQLVSLAADELNHNKAVLPEGSHNKMDEMDQLELRVEELHRRWSKLSLEKRQLADADPVLSMLAAFKATLQGNSAATQQEAEHTAEAQKLRQRYESLERENRALKALLVAQRNTVLTALVGPDEGAQHEGREAEEEAPTPLGKRRQEDRDVDDADAADDGSGQDGRQQHAAKYAATASGSKPPTRTARAVQQSPAKSTTNASCLRKPPSSSPPPPLGGAAQGSARKRLRAARGIKH